MIFMLLDVTKKYLACCLYEYQKITCEVWL